MDEEFKAFMTEPMSDEERRAGIRNMVGDAADLPPLDPQEAIALFDGFLRARRDSGLTFSSIELERVVNWGQRSRLDGLLLENLRQGLMGIDVEGPDILFCAAPEPASFSAASALAASSDDPDLDGVQLAFAAVRWAAGQIATALEREQVSRWVRIAAANEALLDALVDCPEMTIDYDERGRVVIYSPERL